MRRYEDQNDPEGARGDESQREAAPAALALIPRSRFLNHASASAMAG
jgi:hypothetical protein